MALSSSSLLKSYLIIKEYKLSLPLFESLYSFLKRLTRLKRLIFLFSLAFSVNSLTFVKSSSIIFLIFKRFNF